jgi:hypothetical protein
MKLTFTTILFLFTAIFLGYGQHLNASSASDPNLMGKANGFLKKTSKGFEENKGQVTGEDAGRVKFMLKDGNLSMFLLSDGIAYQFNQMHYPEGYKQLDQFATVDDQRRMSELSKDIRLETYRMDVRLVGANENPRITTEGKSQDYVQYYNHNTLNVHHYSKVTYHEVYPNIDWVIYSKDGQTKYDFVVRPGGNPEQIKLKTNWVEDLKLKADGSLLLKNRMGEITEKAPVSFQGSQEILTKFELKNGILGINLGNYSKEDILVIDPALIWATYYGGTFSDQTLSCKADLIGNVYFSGITQSSNNIASGGYQNTNAGGNDAYLAKFSSSGTLIWATYYGGTGNDDGRACVVDLNGDVYLAGLTTSSSNIAIGGHQTTIGSTGFNDCYIVKFNSNGVRSWATYYGGSLTETMSFNTLAIDNNNDLYLAANTGTISSISGGFQTTNAGSADAFLVKFNSSGTQLWATYYGSTDNDDARGCFTDASGNVYLVGASRYGSGLASGGHQNLSGGGEYEAYLVKFNSSGLRQWATYYGGTGNDYFMGGLVDGAGDLYIIGNTSSTNNIAQGGFQNTNAGGANDAMIIKFSSDGVRLWGTYFGGPSNDDGRACAIDPSGNVYFAGSTNSSTGIALNGFMNTPPGGTDAFLLKMANSGTILWGTYFGGGIQADEGFSCTFDNTNGKVYLAGRTASTSGIAFGGHQNTFGGNSSTGAGDGFVAQFDGICNHVPAPTGSNSQTFCNAATVSNLTATGSSIQWYTSSTGGTALLTGSALATGTTYYATQTLDGCESVSPLAVAVTINTPAAPTGSASQTFCNSAIVSNLTATGSSIQWYDAPTGGTALTAGTLVIDGTTYYASQTISGCESLNRFAVTVTISACENCLDFDGVNDRVDLPASVHSGLTTAGTIEAWIKTSANNSGYRGIVVRSNYYGLFLVDNKLSTYVFGGGAPVGVTTYNSVALNDGQWHHVALRFQIGVSGGAQMYLDGLPVGPAITLTTLTSANNFQIGSNTTIQNFIGNIDNVKIWSRLLTPQELMNSYSCIANGTANLNAEYRFNQALAGQNNAGITSLTDASGLNNNGTLLNFALNGVTSNWISGYTCTPNLCPAPIGNSSQSLCSGATVADLVANGQNIQWYEASLGGTALNPSTPLVSGSVYYASQTTVDCESASRFAVTVTLNAIPLAPTGSTAQTTCGGTLTNLTITGTNIQWYDVPTGGSPLASNTPLVNGNTYHASQTVNGCESTSRLAVTVTSETPPPTGAATQEYCSPSTLNNLPANVTGTTLKYYSTPTGGSALPFTTPLVNGTTYYVSQTVNGCESVARLAVTTTVYTFTSNMSAPNPQSFCQGGTIADLVASGTPGATISWFVNSNGWQFGGTPIPSGNQLVNNTTYYAGQSFGTNNLCKYVGTAGVQVIINSPAAPTGTATQIFCNSATVANLSASGTAIQWYAASTGGTALSAGTALTNGTTYYATQTVSGCESASRLEVIATINAPTAPTGVATQSFCSGATIGSLSASGAGIQWYSVPTGGSPLLLTTSLVDGTIYYASQTVSGCESTDRLAVTAVFGIPSAPAGAATQTFCNSATISNLVATGSNVQWYAAPSGGSAISSNTSLANGTTYYATQTSGGCESTDRLAVTVSINVPASPTGSVTQDFCNTATVADLNATGASIQWYTESTNGTALSSGTALTNGTTYYASQSISGCESATRLAVSVTINTPAAPIGAASQTICGTGTLNDLSVTGTNITWYDAAIAGNALASTTSLVDGVTYFATQTISGCESLNQLAVTITINAIPLAPAGSATQEFCNSATIADLSVTGTSINWYADAVSTTPLNSTTVISNGSYYATQTVNGCESTDRLVIAVNINAPAAPVGSATQTFCNSGTVGDLTATGTSIQWYSVPNGGTTLLSGTALSDGTYYASQTISGCESATRLAVAVTINTPAAPTGAASQTICGTGTVNDLVVSGTGITWYDAATGGNVLSPTTALVDGTTYFATQSISGCESLNQLAVSVAINAIPTAPTGTATQEFCNSATIADLSVTGTAINWYADAVSTTPLVATTALSNGAVYYATQTVNGCESADRFEVSVAINTPAAPAGSATQSFCSPATVNDLTATGTSIAWYTNATGGAPLASSTALSNGTYYASQTINGCESANRLAVAVTVTLLNPNVTVTGVTLTATQTGANYTWIDCNNGNQAISGANGQSYTATSNGSYAVEVSLNGCSVVSTCSTITSVGVEEDNLDLISLQPNPTFGILTILVSKPTSAVITSSIGAVVALLELNVETKFDTSVLARGIYYLTTSEGQTVKFVKE